MNMLDNAAPCGKVPDMKTPAAKCVCKRCGHKWAPKVAAPQACPRCKQYTWATKPRA